MLFDLAGPLDYFVEAGGVRSADLHAEGRRAAVRPEARARIPLPGLHRPRAAQDRGRRRHRGAQGTEVRVKRRADDADQGRADRAVNEQPPAALTVAADGTLTGKFTADKDGFYRIELDAPTGERVTGVAAVHDRRADRSAADRVDRQAGPRHQRDADRGSVRRGARRGRLRRQGSRARLLGQRRRGEDACGCSTARSGCPR